MHHQPTAIADVRVVKCHKWVWLLMMYVGVITDDVSGGPEDYQCTINQQPLLTYVS